MANLNYIDILIEEISLEGLDGITLPSLWLRMEERGDFQFAMGERVQSFLWQAMVSHPDLTFFQLPNPRPDIERFDRFSHINPVTRMYQHPENLAPEVYDYKEINEDGIIGSCPTFKTRKDITRNIRDGDYSCLFSYSDAMERWGRSLAVVASQPQRNFVLTGSLVLPTMLTDTIQRYYLLERIGRARWNGLSTGSLPQYSCKPLGFPTKSLHYTVKLLCKQKLVKKQLFQARYEGRSSMCNLLRLTRFWQKLPNKVMEMKRAICEYLSKQKGKMQQISVVKQVFEIQTKKKFRMVLSKAKDNIRKENVDYRVVFPSATKTEYLQKDGVTEKQLPVLVLIKEYREEEEEEEEEEQEEEQDCDEEDRCMRTMGRLWDSGTYSWRYDQGFLQQVYHMIYKAGAEGISLATVAVSMGLQFRIARSAVRCLERTGAITGILKSRGKVRISVYVAQPFLEAGSQSFGKALAEFQQKTTELPAELTVPKEEAWEQTEEEGRPDTCLDDDEDAVNIDKLAEEESFNKSTEPLDLSHGLSDVTCTFVDHPSVGVSQHMAHPISNDKLTEKMLIYANIILDLLKRYRVIDGTYMKQGMKEQLAKEGGELAHDICQKTIRRLVSWCEKEGKLNTFNLKLEHKTKNVTAQLICARDITKDDQLVEQAIQKLKLRYFGFLHLPDSKRFIKSSSLSFSEWAHVAKCAVSAAKNVEPHKRGKKAKKWERARLLHRFLWYVIYGYQGSEPGSQRENGMESSSEPLAVPSEEEGTATTSAERDSDREEEPKEPPVYLDVRDWRRYIPPLRKQRNVKLLVGRADGVCSIGDLLLVMPLSVFAPLAKTQDLSIIQDYLKDSNKRHYPITKLPLNILGAMLQLRIYMCAISEVCVHLCRLGLLSIGPLFFNDRSKQYLFVRKTALLLDTTNSLPGNMFTVLPAGMTSFPELTFCFESMEDVNNYWSQLQSIALHTDLNNLSVTDRPCPHTVEVLSMKDNLVCQKFESVVEDYCLPGDRRGAAGTDSNLFIHLHRNWSAQQIGSTLSKIRGKKNSDSIMEVAASVPSKPQKGGRAKVPPKLHPAKKKKTVATKQTSQHALGSTTAAAPHPTQTEKRQKKKKKREEEEGGNPARAWRLRKGLPGWTLPRNPGGRPGHKRQSRKRHVPDLDDKDRQARLMKKGERARFSAKEVSMVMLGKVAMSFLVPDRTYRQFFIPIRDTLHERLPTLASDKTSRMIQSFVLRQMKKNTKTRLSMSHYSMRLQQDKELVAKYSHAIIPRDVKITDAEAVCPALKALLNDLLSKFMVFDQEKAAGLQPATVRSLNEDYEVVFAEDPSCDFKDWTDVQTDVDVCSVALRDFQLSHLLSVSDKLCRNYEMYATLRQYPEDTVNETFQELTRGGVICRNKKVIDGEVVGSISRYSLHSRLTTRLHKANFPDDFFTSGSDLLSSISEQQRSGEHDSDQDQQTASSEAQFHDLPQGIADPGHVALAIGLTAADKLRMKIEMGSSVLGIDYAEFFPSEKTEERMLSSKRHHSQLDVESNDQDDAGTSLTASQTEGDAAPLAKRARMDQDETAPATQADPTEDGDAVSPHDLLGSSAGDTKQRKRPFSQLSVAPAVGVRSSNEEDITEPAHKQMRLSSNDSSTAGPSSATQVVPSSVSAGLVRKHSDGVVSMETDAVLVRFIPGEMLDVRSANPLASLSQSTLNNKASFKLLALMRMLPGSKLEPLLHSKSNRLSLTLSKVAVSLKKNRQALSTTTAAEPQAQPTNASPPGTAPEQPDVEKPPETSFSKRSSVLPPCPPPGPAASGAETPVWALPWENSSICVDPEVMRRAVLSQTKLLPFSVDLEAFWSSAREGLDDDSFTACQQTYQEILAGGVLGRTWEQLKAAVSVPEDSLYASLQWLVKDDVTAGSVPAVWPSALHCQTESQGRATGAPVSALTARASTARSGPPSPCRAAHTAELRGPGPLGSASCGDKRGWSDGERQSEADGSFGAGQAVVDNVRL